MILSLFHDNPASDSYYSRFEKEHVLVRLRAIDKLVRAKGLAALDPAAEPLVRIGMEVDSEGAVRRNGYGVLNLAWRAEEHPEWGEQISGEVSAIRQEIREEHGAPLRFLIWAGVGGAAEDKSMYSAAGLLNKSPRCYVLDSADPAKLKYILNDIQHRSGLRLPEALKSTLVVGMATGMTSYEAVVNLEKLAALFEKNKVDSRPNFLYMTPPGSELDEFASQRGYRRVELQPDNENTIAGRHSGPLTRGSLYPLGLSKVNLGAWLNGAALVRAHIETAWRLAAFLHTQAVAGRDKVTIALPKPWAGAGVWTKQNFEESLGKSEELGLKIILENRLKLANYRSPKEAGQDRCFLAVKVRGFPKEPPAKESMLRRSGYPLASLTLPKGSPLSSYMQFIHYTVFGLAYLREMNFVTQPGVELYNSLAQKLYRESLRKGGVENCREWQKTAGSDRCIRHRSAITLRYDRLRLDIPAECQDAPSVYAAIVKRLLARHDIEYADLTFFGDTRYSPAGRDMLKVLNRSAERFFRSRLKLPVDVYEGPAMIHSYHEMIVGHGRCLSTLIFSEKPERLKAAGYDAQYHTAQFLAAQVALEQKSRPVVSITMKDMEEASLGALEDFFRQAGASLRSVKI